MCNVPNEFAFFHVFEDATTNFLHWKQLLAILFTTISSLWFISYAFLSYLRSSWLLSCDWRGAHHYLVTLWTFSNIYNYPQSELRRCTSRQWNHDSLLDNVFRYEVGNRNKHITITIKVFYRSSIVKVKVLSIRNLQ